MLKVQGSEEALARLSQWTKDSERRAQQEFLSELRFKRFEKYSIIPSMICLGIIVLILILNY